MGRSCCELTLLPRREFGEITMVITLPVHMSTNAVRTCKSGHVSSEDIHFVIKDFRLPRFSFGDERLVQHIEHVLTDTLKLELNLLAVVTNSANMFICTLRLLFLLD